MIDRAAAPASGFGPRTGIEVDRVLAGTAVERERTAGQAFAVARLSKALAEETGDFDALVKTIATLTGHYLDSSAVLRVHDDLNLALEVVAWHDPAPARMVPIVEALSAVKLRGGEDHPAQQVFERGEAMRYSGAAIREASAAIAPDQPGLLIDHRVRDVLWVPLRATGSVIGTLALFRFANDLSGEFSGSEVRFAQDLADRAALGIQNSRLVNRLREELGVRLQAEQSMRLSVELLKQSDLRRRELLTDLVAAQEEERQLIASDVHDDSLQAMASVGIGLDRLYRRLGGSEHAAVVAELREDVDAAVARLRDLLFTLNPVTLEREGLARAFEVFLTRYFPADSVEWTVSSTLTIDPPDELKVVLFRVAQEALVNVRKHAMPKRITVSLSTVNAGYAITVQDDGIGFDTATTSTRPLPGHMGMRTMRRRAEGAGGWLLVDSAPGAGTSVHVWIPERFGGEADASR